MKTDGIFVRHKCGRIYFMPFTQDIKNQEFLRVETINGKLTPIDLAKNCDYKFPIYPFKNKDWFDL